jgi:hypothetical protein
MIRSILALALISVPTVTNAGEYLLTRSMENGAAATAPLNNIEACITMSAELYGRWNGGRRYQCFDKDTGKMVVKIGCEDKECKAWDRTERLVAIVDITNDGKETTLRAVAP